MATMGACRSPFWRRPAWSNRQVGGVRGSWTRQNESLQNPTPADMYAGHPGASLDRRAGLSGRISGADGRP